MNSLEKIITTIGIIAFLGAMVWQQCCNQTTCEAEINETSSAANQEVIAVISDRDTFDTDEEIDQNIEF
ncbi:MAG: hypothetical protein CMP51_03810 [Flavobacteriales bacterium]|nr:hypothetical protein [Flavobacteriales bacterium]|tara:strand:- start:1141 stop:1347 length:207 start_codon:yes stop_codon:yes gene_type:complete